MVFGFYLCIRTQQAHGSSHVICLLVEIVCYKWCCVQLYIFSCCDKKDAAFGEVFLITFSYICACLISIMFMLFVIVDYMLPTKGM